MQAAYRSFHKPGARFIRHREESEQQVAINWFKKMFPGAIIYTDFAAGLNLSAGERIKMMKQRSRKGMNDIFIDEPMTHIIDGKTFTYHGARFEFKKKDEKVYKKDGVTLRKSSYKREYKSNGRSYVTTGDHLQEQADTLEAYNKRGYYARFTVGVEEFQKHAAWFMGVRKSDSPF